MPNLSYVLKLSGHSLQLWTLRQAEVVPSLHHNATIIDQLIAVIGAAIWAIVFVLVQQAELDHRLTKARVDALAVCSPSGKAGPRGGMLRDDSGLLLLVARTIIKVRL